MPRFSEKSVVEDYLVKELQTKGWTFVPANMLDREGYEEPLLVKNLIRNIQHINEDMQITEQDIKTILNELRLKASGIEGSNQSLSILAHFCTL